jgi:hypothetical protein
LLNGAFYWSINRQSTFALYLHLTAFAGTAPLNAWHLIREQVLRANAPRQ